MKSKIYLVIGLLSLLFNSKYILKTDAPQDAVQESQEDEEQKKLENESALKMEILISEINLRTDKDEKIKFIRFLQRLNKGNYFNEKTVIFVDSEKKHPLLYNTVQNLASKLGVTPPPLIFIFKGDGALVNAFAIDKKAVAYNPRPP